MNFFLSSIPAFSWKPDCWGFAVAFSSCLRVRAGWHPGWVASPSQGQKLPCDHQFNNQLLETHFSLLNIHVFCMYVYECRFLADGCKHRASMLLSWVISSRSLKSGNRNSSKIQRNQGYFSKYFKSIFFSGAWICFLCFWKFSELLVRVTEASGLKIACHQAQQTNNTASMLKGATPPAAKWFISQYSAEWSTSLLFEQNVVLASLVENHSCTFLKFTLRRWRTARMLLPSFLLQSNCCSLSPRHTKSRLGSMF